MRGRPELQSGAILLLIGGAGLLALRVWGSSATPAGATTVFTANGFVSAVTGIMLGGVAVIGGLLVVLGTILWLVARAREAAGRSR